MSNPNRAMAKEDERKSVVEDERVFNTRVEADAFAEAQKAKFDKVRVTRFATGSRKRTVFKFVVRSYTNKESQA